MKKKTYALQAEEMRPLAPGHGGCIATDMITVQGKKVGYMVREPTDRPHDSGWCFMSGDESQEYLDDPENQKHSGSDQQPEVQLIAERQRAEVDPSNH